MLISRCESGGGGGTGVLDELVVELVVVPELVEGEVPLPPSPAGPGP